MPAAQSVERQIPGLGLFHDLVFVRSSPASGSALHREATWDSFSPSVPPLPLTLSDGRQAGRQAGRRISWPILDNSPW